LGIGVSTLLWIEFDLKRKKDDYSISPVKSKVLNWAKKTLSTFKPCIRA
jgi:hypothetical protein